jgi:hypothetical protein
MLMPLRLYPADRRFGRSLIETRTSTVFLQASPAGGAVAQVVSRFEDVRPQAQPSENEAEATRKGEDTEGRRIDLGHADPRQPGTRPLMLTSPASFVHPGDVLRRSPQSRSGSDTRDVHSEICPDDQMTG